jgi:hypothetical protein
MAFVEKNKNKKALLGEGGLRNTWRNFALNAMNIR